MLRSSIVPFGFAIVLLRALFCEYTFTWDVFRLYLGCVKGGLIFEDVDLGRERGDE
jgi:hypothetical protein